jgi:hypothetical protein
LLRLTESQGTNWIDAQQDATSKDKEHKGLTLDPDLNHMNSSNIHTLYFFKIHLIVALFFRITVLGIYRPWYVPNTVIRRELQIPTVKEEIRRYSSQCSARLSAHPNGLMVNLIELPDNRQLRRHLPNDLPTRFLV